MTWYHKAADQGYALAQFNIGVLHGNGTGVKQDQAEALKWYREAGLGDAGRGLQVAEVWLMKK